MIVNKSGRAVEPTGVSTQTYGSAMMHATEVKGGMASMTMASSVSVPAGDAFAFRLWGHHVMVKESPAPRTVGEQVPLIFTLADGRSLHADCTIKPAGAVGS